jgi:N4-gp56 family major capsid protein
MVQLWQVADEGGFMYAPELSKILRREAQPLTKFRQFLQLQGDETDVSKMHNGATFYWNVYENVGRRGTRLSETSPIPQTSFKIVQRSATITEFGNSVPYTVKLETLSAHDVTKIIRQEFGDDIRKSFDWEGFNVMNQTKLRVAPAGGTSTTSITFTQNGATTVTNNVEMGKDHVKAIVDTMKERNVPAWSRDDYFAISRPTTLRKFKNDLETIHQYVESGINRIMAGEIGRYEGVRFIEQTNIPDGGANDSTTFDPLSDTPDPWNNLKSSWAFFFGADVGMECVVIPEEIRAGIPQDFGRSKAIAWYYMGGFGCSHPDAKHGRIFKWDSAQ